MRWVLSRAVIGIVVSVSVAVALLYVAQDAFVFGAPQDVGAIGDRLPGAEEVTYRATDGVELRGWFLPATQPASGITAIVFHGSHSTRADMSAYASKLAGGGVSVLLAEYHGFGGVGGSPSEEALLLDGAAAVAYARSRADVDGSRLVYVGYSLGTGVAVAAAVDAPPAALVLLAPYTSLADVAWSRLPGIPYRFLMRTQLDSRSRIGAVDAPVLVVRGTEDREVPSEQSAELFDAANQPKELITIVGAGHDLVVPSGPTTSDLTLAFLEPLRR